MERPNDKENRIPENDPSKAMDSKREVEQSPDEKTDQDFPGYPHYPSREDMMDKRTDSHRVDLDVENLSSGPNKTGVSQRFGNQQRSSDSGGEGNEGNDENLSVLRSTNGEIGTPQNVSNEDLSGNDALPGTSLNDEVERFTTDGESTQYGTLDQRHRRSDGEEAGRS